VLKEVARTTGKGTPRGCYACRFGGEEFSIIMPGKGVEEAYQIAQAIHVAIPALRFEEDPELVITISMGVLTADFMRPEAQELKSFEDAIELADQELYRAKLDGRNCIKHKTIV
jgi:two-component system, sensor histidine kinase LadS